MQAEAPRKNIGHRVRAQDCRAAPQKNTLNNISHHSTHRSGIYLSNVWGLAENASHLRTYSPHPSPEPPIHGECRCLPLPTRRLTLRPFFHRDLDHRYPWPSFGRSIVMACRIHISIIGQRRTHAPLAIQRKAGSCAETILQLAQTSGYPIITIAK